MPCSNFLFFADKGEGFFYVQFFAFLAKFFYWKIMLKASDRPALPLKFMSCLSRIWIFFTFDNLPWTYSFRLEVEHTGFSWILPLSVLSTSRRSSLERLRILSILLTNRQEYFEGIGTRTSTSRETSNTKEHAWLLVFSLILILTMSIKSKFI